MRLLLAIALLLPTLASAADRTATAPKWKGDLYAGYDGGVEVLRLQDRASSDDPYLESGSGVRQRHGLLLSGRFAAWHGIQARIDLPIVAWDRVTWSEAHDWTVDPDVARPVMGGGSLLPQSVLDTGSSSRPHYGVGDIGLGFRIAPIGADAILREPTPLSLAFDFLLTAPSGTNHDALRDDGSGGPGEGGAGIQLGMAASKRTGGVEPWLAVRYTAQAPYSAPLKDSEGAPLAAADSEGNTELDPADSFRFALGTEIIAREDVAADTSIRIDFGAAVTYVGPDEISSGTRLPAPLDQTSGHVASTAEHVLIEAMFGVRARPKPPVELRIDVAAAWVSSHTLERVGETAYGVQTAPGTLAIRYGVGALIRFR